MRLMLQEQVMHETAAIGIMCKAPRPGRSKTRLIGIVDGVDAAGLSASFIRDVAQAIDLVPVAIGRKGYAVYAPAGSEAEIRAIVPPGFDLLLQADHDFGVVLHAAASALIAAGHDSVVLVNSDSPTLPTGLLVDAIAALRAEGDRMVLGPAIDGGYYLIGLKRAHAAVFANISWSTSAVLDQTMERAASAGIPVELLPAWYDIDDAETFAILEAELRGCPPAFAAPGLRGGDARATRAFLQALGREHDAAGVLATG
jgi:rSAM/selenodomain-associated transferase 1